MSRYFVLLKEFGAQARKHGLGSDHPDYCEAWSQLYQFQIRQYEAYLLMHGDEDTLIKQYNR